MTLSTRTCKTRDIAEVIDAVDKESLLKGLETCFEPEMTVSPMDGACCPLHYFFGALLSPEAGYNVDEDDVIVDLQKVLIEDVPYGLPEWMGTIQSAWIEDDVIEMGDAVRVLRHIMAT